MRTACTEQGIKHEAWAMGDAWADPGGGLSFAHLPVSSPLLTVLGQSDRNFFVTKHASNVCILIRHVCGWKGWIMAFE